jgi:hypothetical protein
MVLKLMQEEYDMNASSVMYHNIFGGIQTNAGGRVTTFLRSTVTRRVNQTLGWFGNQFKDAIALQRYINKKCF